MSIYEVEDWQNSIASRRVRLWKRAFYALTRPAMRLQAARRLDGELMHPSIDGCIGPRGFTPDWRRRWIRQHHEIAGSILLVEGTGSGWDAATWAMEPRAPRLAIGVDLFAFQSWPKIMDGGLPVAFAQDD